MTTVTLNSQEIRIISNNDTTINGANDLGIEVITINQGVTGIVVDTNVERIELCGNYGDFTYKNQSNNLVVYSGSTVVATITIQSDANGTQLTFSNGTVNVMIGQAGMTMGGVPVVTGSAATITPLSINQWLKTTTPPPVTNSPPTGSVTISGSTTVGSTLTATNDLADVDGLGTLSYQWITGSSNINGATSSTYVTQSADIGNNIACVISYVDGKSKVESVTSNIIVPVASLAIGDSYGGGYYAGNIVDNGVTYKLIVAPRSVDATKTWSTTSNTSPAGNAAQTLTDGVDSSIAMNSSTYPAAHYCKGLSTGGHNDWYLPARDELEVVYRNLKPGTVSNVTTARDNTGYGGDGLGMGTNANSSPSGSAYSSGSPAQTSVSLFQTGGTEAFHEGYYWTSTEFNSYNGWSMSFSNGTQHSNPKTGNDYVRPIRRVV